MNKTFLKIALTASISLPFLTGCINATEMGAGSKRPQLVMVSQNHVVKKADKIVATKLKRTKGVYWYREERLVRVLNTLIPYADQYNTKGEKIDWAVYLWQTKKFNAGALANGTVLISRTMANHKDLNDADIAYIMAHEMAHVIRQHHRELATWRYIVQPALITAGLATGGVGSVVGLVGHDIYGNGFKKNAEKEADALGLEIYASAGYDPENALTLYKKIKPIHREYHPFLSRIPSILTTHPSFKTRTKRAEKNMVQYKDLQAKHTPLDSGNLITYDFKKGLVTAPNGNMSAVDSQPQKGVVNTKEESIMVQSKTAEKLDQPN